jgi:hypothetical protein
VQLHRLFDNGQTQPPAPNIGDTIPAIERVEDVFAILFGDANAFVFDAYPGATGLVAMQIDENGAARRGLLDRVSQQIGQCLSQ